MRGPVAMATGRLVLYSGRSGREETGFEGGNGWICDHRSSLKFQGLRGGQREGVISLPFPALAAMVGVFRNP